MEKSNETTVTSSAMLRRAHRLEALQDSLAALKAHADTLDAGRPNSKKRWHWVAFDEAASVLMRAFASDLGRDDA